VKHLLSIWSPPRGLRFRLSSVSWREALQRLIAAMEEAALQARLADRDRLAALLLGAAAPAVVFGNAVLGAAFGLAALAAAPGVFGDRVQRWRLRGLLLTWPGALGVATAGWWAVSSVFSLDPGVSFEVLGRMLLFILAAGVLVAALAERTENREQAESVFVFAYGGLVGLASIAMYSDSGLLRLFAPFTSDLTDPLTFFKGYASMIAVMTPTALWIGWRRGGAALAAAGLGAVGALFLIWGDGDQIARASVGGLVGAGGALVLILALRRRSSALRKRVAFGVGAAAAALAVLVLMRLPAPPVDEAFRADPPLPMVDIHRQAIWGFVFDKALERPVLGFGINTINTVEGAKDEVLDLNQEYVPSHPHNFALEIMSETGLPGLLLLIASQIVLFIGFARAAFAGRAGGLAAATTLAAFWVSSLANFSIWSAWWQVGFLAVIVLPAARCLGPEIEPRQDDAAPSADWRRLLLVGGCAALALLLALVWYARRTDEGYILYKRLFAQSEYLYDEIRPDYKAVDAAALIRPETQAEAAELRAQIAEIIWGPGGVPAGRLPASVEPAEAQTVGLKGPMVAGAERVVIPIDETYQAHAWILQPTQPNGRGVVYNHGYAGTIDQARPLIHSLVSQGYAVAALNFPGYGDNAYRSFDHPRFGPVSYDHDFGLYFMDKPLRLYIEPAIVAANHLRAAVKVTSVDVVGFSAGGWVAGVAAAVDPRFRRSASVASFLPIYLRDRREPGDWTPPHLYPPLLQTTNYLEIPLLAALGEGRGYLQVFNRYDRCCYRNRVGLLYEEAVRERVARIGTGGAFDVAIDETHADHKVSAWAMDRISDVLRDGASSAAASD
jgi:O-antigen ligase/dienelactone hydrolase